MLTPEQVTAWTKVALHHLDHLRGPVLCWEEPYPIPIRFCDGHAVHQGDLRELRKTFLMTVEAARNRAYGEDGNPLGIPTLNVFLALFGMIINAQRV